MRYGIVIGGVELHIGIRRLSVWEQALAEIETRERRVVERERARRARRVITSDVARERHGQMMTVDLLRSAARASTHHWAAKLLAYTKKAS